MLYITINFSAVALKYLLLYKELHVCKAKVNADTA